MRAPVKPNRGRLAADAQGDVLAYAKEHGARSFDAPGAKFTHRDGRCTFEVLVEEFRIEDAAVRRIAAIVHGADIDDEIEATPQSAGLLAIAEGFRHMEDDDQRWLALQLPLYDALYQWARRQPEGPAQT